MQVLQGDLFLNEGDSRFRQGKKYPFICGWHLRHKGKTLTDCHRRVLFFKLSVNMSLDVFKFKLNKTKHQSFDVLFVCFIFNYHKKLNNIVGA